MHPPSRRPTVATAYLRAELSVMAMGSLLLNLSGPATWKDCVWRDDAQLPSYPGVNYARVQQRPITGQEEYLIRGYDVARLKFTGTPGLDSIRLANSKECLAVPFPVIGAVFLTNLCCT